MAIQLVTATWGTVTLEADGSHSHPNEMPFKGTLLLLGTASEKPPNGAKGHRILVPKLVAQKRLDTLLGMGVNLSRDNDSHAPQRKVGVIKKAWIEGNELKISGVIWKKDFPDAEKALKEKQMGMSFEGSEVQIEDQKAIIWTVADLMFTGAALLLKTAAAYSKTEALAASAMYAKLVGIDNGGVEMPKTVKDVTVEANAAFSPKVLAEALAAAMSPLAAAIAAQTEAITSMHASQESSQVEILEMLAKGKDEEEDDEEEEDEEKPNKKVAAAKNKHEDEDDDEDEEDEDDEGEDDVEGKGKACKAEKSVKAKSDVEDAADDADELENLEDEDVEDTETPGKMNQDADKDKGKKTTVTASARLRKLVTKLMAQNEKLAKNLKASKTQVEAAKTQVEAAAERVSRKSKTATELSRNVATINANATKPSKLLTGLLDKYEVKAEGESGKMSMAEFNEVLNAKGITDPTTRIALKTEAERNGNVYTGTDSQL